MFDLAQEYYKENSSLLSIKEEKMKNWIQVQRGAYKENETSTKLSEEKIKKLESIGMIWNVKEKEFSDMYELAQKYYEEHGNLLLHHKYMINEKNLSSWIKEKRRLYKKGTLSVEQIEQLEAIGMIWDIQHINGKLCTNKHKNIIMNMEIYQ